MEGGGEGAMVCAFGRVSAVPEGGGLSEGEHLTDGRLLLFLPVPRFDGDGSAVDDQSLQILRCFLEGGRDRSGEREGGREGRLT